MPVVHVRSLAVDQPQAGETLTLVAARVAEAVPCAIDDVWCTFERLAAETIGARQIDEEGRIVFVDVWLRERDAPEAASRALVAACQAASDGLDVPLADVWGALHHVTPGRVFAGGGLLG